MSCGEITAPYALIADAAVQAILILECGEPLVDVATLAPLSVIAAPEHPAMKPHYTRVRRSVAERLLRVQQSLPAGIRVRLYEGYRSLQVQQMLFAEHRTRITAARPDIAEEDLHRETGRLVSPVVNRDGSRNIPPHATGGAVDIELTDERGEVLDFGMCVADWPRVAAGVCATAAAGIGARARENRALLIAAMTREGFVNYPAEWWHFSYGDRYWAYQSGAECARYGVVRDENI